MPYTALHFTNPKNDRLVQPTNLASEPSASHFIPTHTLSPVSQFISWMCSRRQGLRASPVASPKPLPKGIWGAGRLTSPSCAPQSPFWSVVAQYSVRRAEPVPATERCGDVGQNKNPRRERRASIVSHTGLPRTCRLPLTNAIYFCAATV
jgi:hypothetical protein